MSDFQQRLRQAIQRGTERHEMRSEQSRQQQLSADELKSLHSKHRIYLSDHIETCIKQMVEQLPGFKFETVYGERGWGAACSRDDFGGGRGKRTNLFSRLEMTVRPFSELQVLELTAKGTVRNKEVFSRTHFEELADAAPDKFVELIDFWAVDYAELYVAKS